MTLSADNPVVALCAAGMEREGTPSEALRLFEEAWSIRTDDYDAAIAAHYVARHQPTPADTLRWNRLALDHAERVGDGRVTQMLPSLCLCVADNLFHAGDLVEARILAVRAREGLSALPEGGYRNLIAGGITRLESRLAGGNAT